MTDIEIIDSIKRGNDETLKKLYVHKSMIVNMVRIKGGTLQDGEDIFHNALFILFHKIKHENFNLTSKISTFLYSVARNNWIKSYKKSFIFNHDITTDEISELIENNDNFDNKLFTDCLSLLTDNERKIISLFYFDDMSFDQIAKIMSYSSSDTAKSVKYRAMKKLTHIILTNYNKTDFF